MQVSIVVPVYNVKNYLVKCVDSLEAQRLEDFEIILVDDGSTDGSGELCDDLKKQYENIVVVHKPNGGLSSARNAGIDVACGEYIGFVDSDDFVEKGMYSHLYEAIKRTKKSIACCGRYLQTNEDYITEEFTLIQEKEFTREEAVREILLLEKIDVSACDKLYRRYLFDDLRFPVGKISEDAAVIFEIINKSNGIVHVGKPYYHYIFRKGSITKSKYNEKKYDVMTNLKKTDIFIKKYYPKLEKENKIYGCICSAALLIDMWEDKEAKYNYPEHYKEYRRTFNDGFWNTITSPEIRNKMKLRVIAIKTHSLGMFMAVKKMYMKISK